MSNYIKTLSNKAKRVVSKDLAYLIKSNTLPDNLIHDILRPTSMYDKNDEVFNA